MVDGLSEIGNMGRIVVATTGMGAFTFMAPLDQPVGLRPLQQMVGGNIEFIVSPLDDLDPELSIFGYEEARIFGHDHNEAMTHWLWDIYRYDMLGTFVILSSDENGNSMPLDHASFEQVVATFPAPINTTDHPMSEWENQVGVVHG